MSHDILSIKKNLNDKLAQIETLLQNRSHRPAFAWSTKDYSRPIVLRKKSIDKESVLLKKIEELELKLEDKNGEVALYDKKLEQAEKQLQKRENDILVLKESYSILKEGWCHREEKVASLEAERQRLEIALQQAKTSLSQPGVLAVPASSPDVLLKLTQSAESIDKTRGQLVREQYARKKLEEELDKQMARRRKNALSWLYLHRRLQKLQENFFELEKKQVEEKSRISQTQKQESDLVEQLAQTAAALDQALERNAELQDQLNGELAG